jgi:hypothetical protein
VYVFFVIDELFHHFAFFQFGDPFALIRQKREHFAQTAASRPLLNALSRGRIGPTCDLRLAIVKIRGAV